MAFLMHTRAHSHVARRAARWTWGLALAAAALALGGCASTVTTQVTRFHQWPSHTQGTTYAVVPATLDMHDAPTTVQPLGAAQTLVLPELEAQTYAAELERGLQAQGLVPAARAEQARLAASLSVQSRQDVVEVRTPVMRPMFGFGLGFGGRGRWGYGASAGWPFGWGGDDDYPYGWRDRVTMQPVQNYRLRVRIADRGQAGKTPAAPPTVFDATAEYTGAPASLNTVMPYLMRAVFADFPGASGQTRQVVFDAATGQRVRGR